MQFNTPDKNSRTTLINQDQKIKYKLYIIHIIYHASFFRLGTLTPVTIEFPKMLKFRFVIHLTNYPNVCGSDLTEKILKLMCMKKLYEVTATSLFSVNPEVSIKSFIQTKVKWLCLFQCYSIEQHSIFQKLRIVATSLYRHQVDMGCQRLDRRILNKKMNWTFVRELLSNRHFRKF